MSPFGIESLPGEVLEALRTLPLLGDRLRDVAASTRELPAVRSALDGVKSDTVTLPGIEGDVRAIATDVLPSMDERLQEIAGAMPVIAEVQQHLARLPETMQTLDAGIVGLARLLEQLLISIETLDNSIAGLHETVAPVGRIADKLPGGSRKR